MVAKIWSYSGWINNIDPQQIKKNFGKLLVKAGFTVLGFKDHVFEPHGYTCFWILGESHFAVHTFPEDGCSFIELSSCNESKLYDFLTMLPEYFDLLVNDADGGQYPAQKDGMLIEGFNDEERNDVKDLFAFREKFVKQKVIMPYNFPALQSLYDNGNITIHRDDEGNIKGYYILKDYKKEDKSKVLEICSQEKGLGTDMMKEIFEKAKSDNITLDVVDYNEKAINFYKKFGFQEISRADKKGIINIEMQFVRNNKEKGK